jgi:hypothetical protein
MTEAVVFVPGIGRQPFGEAPLAEGVGTRLLAALGRNSEGAAYISETATLSLSAPFGQTAYLRVMAATAQAEKAPVLDVYALDLPALLLEPYRNLGTKSRALKLGWLLFLIAPRLFEFWRRREKSLLEQVQMAVGAAMFLLMLAVFAGGLIVLLAGAAQPILKGTQFEFASGWLVAAAALITLVLANVPPALRAQMNANLVTTLVVGNYVAAGGRKDAAMGRFGEFVDQLLETGHYERLHVIAYSVGSLIVLDALFPTTTTIHSSSESTRW